MRALENVSTAHLVLADSYRDQALRYLERARLRGPARRPARRRPRLRRGPTRGRSRRPSSSSRPRRVPGGAEPRPDERDGAHPVRARVLGVAPGGRGQDRAPGSRVGPRAGGGVERPSRRRHGRGQARPRDRRAWSWPIARRSRSSRLADSVPPHLRPPAAFALASLGSVLLGQARPHEALGVLGSAETLAPEHPTFDDVRWMLGQALLCAAAREWRSDFPPEVRRADPNWREANSPQLEAIDALRQEAAVVLDRVRNHERSPRGTPVRRPHGHRRVAERLPRGLARNSQRARGAHPVHPQAGGGSRPGLPVRTTRREGAAAVRGAGEGLPPRVGRRGGAAASRGARGGLDGRT